MNVKELWMKTDAEYSNAPALEWAEKFADLVAAAEREECAKLCEHLANAVSNENHIAIEQRQFCAKAIRITLLGKGRVK